MQNKKALFKITSLIIGISVLTACSNAQLESSSEVVKKFKENLVEIQTADMTVDVAMKGVDSSDKIDFSLAADAKVDRSDELLSKMDVSLEAEGKLNTDGKDVSGKIALKLRSLGDEFYFNLVDFDVNDPSIERYKILVSAYQNKWQHLASDFVPENIRELQVKDEETKQKEEALKQLFVNTKLFNISKEYGLEKVNGNDVYHVGIKLNEDGFKSYLKQAAEINDQPMTDEEVAEAIEFIESISNIEVWIGQGDYHLYKAILEFSAEDIAQEVESEVKITYTAKSYNEPMTIEAPSDFSEFNPLALLMGMQMGAGLNDSALPSEALDEGDEVSAEENK